MVAREDDERPALEGVAVRDAVPALDEANAFDEFGPLGAVARRDGAAARVRGKDPGVIGQSFCDLPRPQHIVCLLFFFNVGRGRCLVFGVGCRRGAIASVCSLHQDCRAR